MHIVWKNKKYIAIFLLVGVIIYLPGLLNGFVWDDKQMILKNALMQQLSVKSLLGPSLFNSGLFYRPITAVYFGTLYSLFREQAIFYHVIQLGLHIIASVLVFMLFLRLFSRPWATFLTLVFLVHPINVEAVTYISATNNQLYFLPGMAALLLGLEPKPKNWKIATVCLLLLLSASAKENGFLFLPIILLYRYLYRLNKVVLFAIAGTMTGICYLVIRTSVLGMAGSADVPFIPITELPLMQRLISIPAIILYYLKTLIFPWHLSIWQVWVKTLSFTGFVVPLLITLILVISLLVYMVYLYAEDEDAKPIESNLRKFIFFTCWYILGMAMLIQIVPLEMTVADRWFYFTLVGALGIIGTLLQPLRHFYQKRKGVLIIISILVISLLSVRTFFRVLDWKDNLTLYQHDAEIDSKNDILLDSLATEFRLMNRVGEALVYAEMAAKLSPNLNNLVHLGNIYASNMRYHDAILAYSRAIEISKSYSDNSKEIAGLTKRTDSLLEQAYGNLSAAYLEQGQLNDARDILEQGMKRLPESSFLKKNLDRVDYIMGVQDEIQ